MTGGIGNGFRCSTSYLHGGGKQMGERIAIYARVSTEDQAERDTIEAQLHTCREHAEFLDAQVVAEYRDEGVSGTVPLDERPEGRRLLEAAEEKLFDCVLIYRLDRLAREMTLGLRAFKQLESAGTPVTSVSETWDDSPSGRFMYREFMNIAELERDLIRDRTTAGRRRRVRSGKYLASRTPYGYEYLPETGQLKPHPEQAEVVRRMFRWALEGLGLMAISERLRDEGIPSPHADRSQWEWHISTVHRILTAPRYIGKGTYAGEPMPCPALVDERTFSTVQQVLRRRAKDHPRNVKRLYLLRHLVYCRTCGGRFMGVSAGSLRYYICRTRRTYGRRAGHDGVKWSWRAEELEKMIKRHVLRMSVDPEYLLQGAHIYEERAEQLVHDEKEEETRLQARLDELDKEQGRVIRLVRKGLIDEAQLERELNDIKSERREVEGRLKVLQERPIDPVKFIRRATELKNTAGLFSFVQELLPHADWGDDSWTDGVLSSGMTNFPGADEAWQSLIQELVDKIWLEPDGSITVEGILSDAVSSNPGTAVNGVSAGPDALSDGVFSYPPLRASGRQALRYVLPNSFL